MGRNMYFILLIAVAIYFVLSLAWKTWIKQYNIEWQIMCRISIKQSPQSLEWKVLRRFFVFGYAFVKKMIILDTAFCCFYNLSMAACNHAVHTYAGAKGRPIAGKKAIPNPPQKLLYNMVLLWVSTLYTQQPCTPGYTLPEMDKKKEALDLQGLQSGGDSWTRTNDPIDVNDVLYRLSHATTCRFEVPTKVSYQLSHET